MKFENASLIAVDVNQIMVEWKIGFWIITSKWLLKEIMTYEEAVSAFWQLKRKFWLLVQRITRTVLETLQQRRAWQTRKQ